MLDLSILAADVVSKSNIRSNIIIFCSKTLLLNCIKRTACKYLVYNYNCIESILLFFYCC